MIVTLSIPDELFEKYQALFPKGVNRGMVAQLKRFSEFGPDERSVVLSPAARLRLEKLLQFPIEDSEKFASWVEGLVSLKLEEVDLKLSPAQVKFIQSGAPFFNKTPATFLTEKLKRGLVYALDGTV